jgi:hypothetical protein
MQSSCLRLILKFYLEKQEQDWTWRSYLYLYILTQMSNGVFLDTTIRLPNQFSIKSGQFPTRQKISNSYIIVIYLMTARPYFFNFKTSK